MLKHATERLRILKTLDRTKTAIAFLVERGLVKEEEYGGTKGYRLTARGGEFLQALKTVKKYLGPEE